MEKNQKSKISKRFNFLQTLTAEPILVLYITFSMMSTLTTENLNLQKTCYVNIGFNKSICEALERRNVSGYTADQEIHVQKVVSGLLKYKTAVQGILPFLLMLFLGSWSDRHKRRIPFILFPLFGDLITTLGCTICTIFFNELSVEVAIFFEAVPVAVTGGWLFFFVGAYCHVTEKTTEEDRSVRLGIMQVLTNVSLTTGMALSGVLYKILGFYGVFSLSTFMFVTAISYGLYALKEEPIQHNQYSFLSDVLDMKHLKRTFSSLFKKRESSKRLKLFLILILVFLQGSFRGELTVLYLFTRRKFTWDAINFSIYATVRGLTHFIGSSFSLFFFVGWLKINDATVGVLGMLSRSISCFASAFAPTTKYFYLAELSEFFDGCSHIALRAISSKLVTPDELGRIFSLFSLMEALAPIVFGPLYSFIYHQTVDFNPATFFFVSVIFNGVGCFLFTLLIFLRENEIGEETVEEEEDTELMFRNPENSENPVRQS